MNRRNDHWRRGNSPLSPQEISRDLHIIVRSHTFEVHKHIAVQASELLADVCKPEYLDMLVKFKLGKNDGDDNDPNPDNFYTVDALAQLVAYMYGRDLCCPTSRPDYHTGCLVAWCKVYNLASHFRMPSAMERSLKRLQECLQSRRYHNTLAIVEEVSTIFGLTKEDSKVRDILVKGMKEIITSNFGDVDIDTVVDWRKAWAVVPESED